MTFFLNVKEVVMENIQNFDRLVRLSWYELIAQDQGTNLGFLWNFINPTIQILIYWFVFSVGLRVSSPIEGYPYVVWMMVGIVPWFYLSEAIIRANGSIYAYASIIKQMHFPLAIIPTKAILSSFIGHLFAVAILLFIFVVNGHSLSWYSLQIIYYMVCSWVFLLGAAFCLSSVAVLIKDFQKIVPLVVRFLFYMTPIVWSIDSLDASLQYVMRLNPFFYIIDGYRDSLIYRIGFWTKGLYTVYFWSFSIILFTLGIQIYLRFRRKFTDII